MAPKAKKESGPPKREYLGWLDANIVEWKAQKEYEGRKNFAARWACPNQWMKRYEKWVCSGINRAMRKPSLRSLEWLAWQQQPETAYVGEWRTRKRYGIKDYFLEPLEHYHCCPEPWPITTYGEIGYLGKHECCQLEIYPNDFMKKPPLPWYVPKIATYLSNSQ